MLIYNKLQRDTSRMVAVIAVTAHLLNVWVLPNVQKKVVPFGKIKRMFLVQQDFSRLITQDNLDELVNQEPSILADTERVAVEEAASYIRHRYDEAKVFADVKSFSVTSSYNAGDVIQVVAEQYQRKTYQVGDIAEYTGAAYICTTAITTPEAFTSTKWAVLGQNGVIFTALVDATGVDITDVLKFQKKDTRNPKIVQVVTDILLYHLHSTISPRNIPELRAVRYDGQGNKKEGESAISYLEKVAKGSITPNLPVKVDAEGVAPITGNRPTWGYGNTSKHSY